jgi:hypothetical protein
MSIPEPLDEPSFAAGGPVEIRGGDHDEDFIPVHLNPGEYVVPAGKASLLPVPPAPCGDHCGCQDEIE